MTAVTNALSSKEASPNEKGQISSINMWRSYSSSYNKWMKKSALLPSLLLGKEMKKRNPSTNTWRVAHNKWMKKGSSAWKKGMKKN
jgi:hypothetical protein